MTHFDVVPSPNGLIVLCENIFSAYLWESFYLAYWLPVFLQITLKKSIALHLDGGVSSIIAIMTRFGVLLLSVAVQLLYVALFIYLKPISHNHGDKSIVILKSSSTQGVLEQDQCLCRSHADRPCLLQHIFPGKLCLASWHLPQQCRGRHLFRYLAEIQCGIFCFLFFFQWWLWR